MSSPDSNWSLDVFRAIQARNITLVCTVPDGGLTNLLDLIDADDEIRLVTLSTEEEGIGIAAGCWLGGRRAMIAMQSSGVGNCINALGLPLAYRAPCLMLVTMRGQWGEFNPWQVPMGQAAKPALAAMGVRCFPVERPEEVGETFAAAADLAFNSRTSAAVLVSQRIIGAKGFGQK
ncbi:MAG TPA: thiamine pyrophosphate-binding protein [Hyphomicrobiaceae bacterium]|nr:thiamine pyrophosphate-binding protein [Hyphomicrobiaceae bacterium]